MPEVFVFAGPSACEISMPADVRCMPPVRRGDIGRLLESASPYDVIVVCDGVFGGEPAVSHAELCRAIDAGMRVWGVSSIGAIRAYEMRFEGMRGFGYVYAQFERLPDFADDEMCLLHFPEPPYFPVTEALVNLRYALEQKSRSLGISTESELSLLAALRALWFADRTENRIRQIMVEQVGIDAPTATALLDWTRRHRIKNLDLARLLVTRPWTDPVYPPAPIP